VQGPLRNRNLTADITSECACCRRPIEMQVDSDLRYRVLSDGAEPLISVPMVDFRRLEDPSIIHAF